MVRERKWQLVSGIDKIHIMALRRGFLFSLLFFGGLWVGERSGKEPVFIYKGNKSKKNLHVYGCFLLQSSMYYLGKKPEKERLLTRGSWPPMCVKQHLALSPVLFTCPWMNTSLIFRMRNQPIFAVDLNDMKKKGDFAKTRTCFCSMADTDRRVLRL